MDEAKLVDSWDVAFDNSLRLNIDFLKQIRALFENGFKRNDIKEIIAYKSTKIVEVSKKLRSRAGISIFDTKIIVKKAYEISKRIDIDYKNIFDDILELGTNNKFRNPEVLKSIVSKINKNQPDLGAKMQLEIASSKVKRGKTIEIENGKADLEDFSSKVSFQMKNVTSTNPNKVISNLKSAIDQLKGRTGNPPEVPTYGHKKVAHIKVNESSNLFSNLERKDILEKIKDAKLELQDIDNIIIENNKRNF